MSRCMYHAPDIICRGSGGALRRLPSGWRGARGAKPPRKHAQSVASVSGRGIPAYARFYCAKSVRSKDVRIQEGIAELALWIVESQQPLKIRQLCVERLQLRRR